VQKVFASKLTIQFQAMQHMMVVHAKEQNRFFDVC